jgi:hypothetical protein
MADGQRFDLRRLSHPQIAAAVNLDWIEDYNSEHPRIPSGLPLAAGVHCINQTVRSSGSTPNVHKAKRSCERVVSSLFHCSKNNDETASDIKRTLRYP